MTCNLKYFIRDEKGSLMPLWAIGGMMVVISVFWVENTSFSIMEKIREMNLAGVITRTSMTEQGNITDNVRKLIEATGDSGERGRHVFSTDFQQATLEDLKKQQRLKRSNELLSTNLSASNDVAVPFEEINKTVGVNTDIRFSTADNSVKVFRPLNVIIAVEGSNRNRYSLMQAKSALINSLARLYSAAPTTRSTIIPYSYRVYANGRCYTGISRSDNFSFSWWEDFFYQEDYLGTLTARLSYAKSSLSATRSNIYWYRQQVSKLTKELNQQLPFTPEYAEISRNIEDIKRESRQAEMMIPSLEDDIDRAKDAVDNQQKAIKNWKENPQYRDYFPLAKHYAKRYSHYPLLENYEDSFANSGIFSITRDDFNGSAGSIYQSPTALSSLAVQRNRYFGDAGTCPASQVSYNLTSYSSVSSKLSNIDFSGTKISSLEGILWAGRSAFTSSTGLTRNVIILFASNMDDVIEPKILTGVAQSCDVIKSSFINNKSAKLVVVTANKEGLSKFRNMNCATQWFNDTGYIVLDDIKKDFSKTLEEQFNYVFSQESTTRNIN